MTGRVLRTMVCVSGLAKRHAAAAASITAGTRHDCRSRGMRQDKVQLWRRACIFHHTGSFTKAFVDAGYVHVNMDTLKSAAKCLATARQAR